ncbi:hypothetical protein GR157_20150 [Burkholderia sp. 4701]|nr:hypothetical protein [Burkholderia sp. 4701]MXN83979.1 hypothetical protein [Burkholderia sp. 4812]
MHTVMTVLLNRPVDGLIDNHADYARSMGYRHVVVDGMHVYGPRQPVLFKYQAILHELTCLYGGDLLLVLDAFSVVFGRQPLDDVARGYDAIVTNQEPASPWPAASGMIFRNTLEVRERVRKLVLEFGHWACYLQDHVSGCEVSYLREAFNPLPFSELLANGHLASVQTIWDQGLAIDFLADAMPLVAHNAPRWQCVDGQWRPTTDYDFRYVTALLEDASVVKAGGRPNAAEMWKIAQHRTREPALHINPGASIAFVTLHTANIAGYGDIHEENFERYCLRHGYGYHSYRVPPAFVPSGVTANWAKMHLIRHHLKDHAFVFWVDADILAINQAESIDAVIAGRDFVIGGDHTAWAVNSCMIGVRDTEAMRDVVEHMCMRIESTKNRSAVYSSGGDQQAIQEGMEHFGMLDVRYIVDAITLATSPVYASREHRFVHFPAQHNHYRAVSMQVWNRWSRESLFAVGVEARATAGDGAV